MAINRSTLGGLAAVLTTLIIVVSIGALDHLPGSLRAQIEAERAAFSSAQTELRRAQDEVARRVQSEPELFRRVPQSGQWPERFQQSAALLQSAGREMDELSRLAKSGHHGDRQRAQTLLESERGLRKNAAEQASAVREEAARWIKRKQDLPAELQQMERNYRAVQAFDLAPLTGRVRQAETDWPEKKQDLEQRLAAMTEIAGRGESLWRSMEGWRTGAAAIDYGALFSAADALKGAAAELPGKADELKTLAAQLYCSWDKILVDMDTRGIGSAREYDQKIRTVRTQVGGPDGKTGVAASEEKWTTVSRATYEAMRGNLGMAVEHKPAGKYDSEAERVAQPAGFAYVAPPSQGSNQYGYWEHRDGRDFWVFYGQYALLRDLLFNRDYRPLDRGDWEQYRTHRDRGQTYYGQEPRTAAPKYGTHGAETKDRYAGSAYGRGGGFRESPYASRGGGYRDSPYASPMARGGERERGGKIFGRSGRKDDSHSARPPSRSYRPAPRSSGAGRRFGGRRR